MLGGARAFWEKPEQKRQEGLGVLMDDKRYHAPEEPSRGGQRWGAAQSSL